MRLLLGLIVVGSMFTGGGYLAWKGLGLDKELTPEPLVWHSAASPVVDTPAPLPSSHPAGTSMSVVTGERVFLSPMPGSASLAPNITTSSGIAVPSNARAGSGYRSSSRSDRAPLPTASSRTKAPGYTYGLQGQNAFTRSLSKQWHSKPKFGFTSYSRKKDLQSNHRSRVNRN